MCQFHQRSMRSFYTRRSQKRKKKDVNVTDFLRFRDLQAQKQYIKH